MTYIPEEPKDLIFEKHKNKLTFAAWYMAYDKGASAGIQIKINTKSGNSKEVDPDSIFGYKVETQINIQDLMSGLSYQDLMDLSAWAKNAAKFVKKAQIKYRGKDNFEKEYKNDSLKVK